jgi:hypothetical protein
MLLVTFIEKKGLAATYAFGFEHGVIFTFQWIMNFMVKIIFAVILNPSHSSCPSW